MAKRTYSDEERTAALAIYVEDGLTEAWRRTGIPKPTIATWVKAEGLRTHEPEKTRAATAVNEERQKLLRSEIRLTLLEKVADLLDRMDAPHVEFKGKDADAVEYPIAPAGAVQNYATSVGILIDKYRLEVGEPTSRSESRALSDDIEPLSDHERQALRTAIDRELDRRSAQPDPA